MSLTVSDLGRVVFRLDAGSDIGAGHAMRCMAIASELDALGAEVLFAVSREESANLLNAFGSECQVLSGDARHLVAGDAMALAEFCKRVEASICLVDTYATTSEFESSLASVAGRCLLAAIDDQYTYENGGEDIPRRLPYGLVINYEAYADEAEYRRVYAGNRTHLLIGPSYAPLRAEFKGAVPTRTNKVTDILVTTGSTNPQGWLDRMARACLAGSDDAVRIHVVVGRSASFFASGERLVVHRDVVSMASLMACCQLAVSAAGSTIYELSAMGVPSVVVPIVENQERNASGFVRAVHGPLAILARSEGEICCAVTDMIERVKSVLPGDNSGLRLVDGFGAHRIAKAMRVLIGEAVS